MKVQFFTIAPNTEKFLSEQQKLNDFLAGIQFVKSDIHFVDAETGYWSVMVHYEDKQIRNISRGFEADLNQQQLVVLKKLKQWRVGKASALDLSIHRICHNSELLDIVLKMPATISELRSIKGFGVLKSEKYGDEIITLINNPSI